MPGFRKVLGYSLLIVSCIAWAALPIIPFLEQDTERLAAWGAGLFVFAEITWWLALPLLGKEVLEWWRHYWGKTKEFFSREKN